ncbi:oligopeptide transporter [Cordyceps fumosorosea ARSEF 2679]|uniref:Oligopeptide transporter n=1 Tax=Cordyceps fumosorosea (strain ARSEF 2679) TaxID=1081104 RepID=A0A162N1Z1_CORFA|nr:oligopeptide transporter [Cordyceps fumosorosea ARSEF 2679]OAA74189.1 oligopeptide transporter [Cordyceps fumosorosea ARSEF 2679]
MAATFQYAKQFSWSKIKRTKQAEFRPLPADDERDSSEGLLEKGGSSPESRRESTARSLWRDPTFLVFQAALLSLYLLVLGLVAAGGRTTCSGRGIAYSPAASVIEWSETKFTLEDHIQDLSIYSGAPSEELDKAWHDLLNTQNVRVEAEYFKHHGREKIGVGVPGSTDYIGTLNVFHELHCIKRLHQFMYPDYYFSDFTQHQMDMNRLHNEHCLDFLRQSAMCHGDIGLITYIWRQDSRLPVVNSTSHQCVNWDKLYAWSEDRAVDMLKPGWLVHPTKGIVYPDGEGDRIEPASSTDSDETHVEALAVVAAAAADHDDVVHDTLDTFVPFTDMPNCTGQIITVRASVVGILCGVLVNASNIYIGLRAGWTTSANVLGAIASFAVLKRASSSFGPHENNIAQTMATASGGMSNVFISGIPALYQLGLLSTPARDLVRLVVLAAIGGYFGLLSIVPLRRFFIEKAARDLNLVFPSSFATAATIRSMHSAAGGERLARDKMRWTVVAFVSAMVLRVASIFLPNVLWNWHIFTWIAKARLSKRITEFVVAAESWGWVLEWSPAMIGSGFLVDFGVACSFFAGAVVAWGALGPYLVSVQLAFGEPSGNSTAVDTLPGLVSYTAMSNAFSTAEYPSPRYWLLWPGVACTLAVAFLELLCQSGKIWKLLSTAVMGLLRKPRKDDFAYTVVDQDPDETKEKPASRPDIELWMWLPSLVVVVVAALVILYFSFNMPLLEAVLALFLALSMSLIAIQATGATDTTPINAISKVSQIALGTITRTSGASVEAAQRLNLVGASLTNIGACQGCDLMGDFRVGFLLGTPAHLQYAAQLIGTLVASLVAPATFLLFATAYPCIISNSDSGTCEFPAPTVAAWRAVAVVASTPDPSIPASSIRFSILLAAISGVLVVAKHVVCSGRGAWTRPYWPNMMIFGLAFTLPNPQTATTMMVGALVAAAWRMKSLRGFEMYAFGVAAGFVAGEGIGGTINCVLSILGIA